MFWVDCGEDVEAVADGYQEMFGTGWLAGEYVVTESWPRYEVHIRYGDRPARVPLTGSEADCHLTVCMLNEVLTLDNGLRFCIDSQGGSTWAFLPLPAAQWVELEQRYGKMVAERFDRVMSRPNLLTDPLPF